ncbi:hypothetical protein SUDANB58_04327 [Streptomyces sp. enrichment culture]|uniref:hypothetical protein n=1 Tax=Streptomyces sp. enrichment culture TaxID=1795815 RepID=UPI003F54E16D
MPPFTSSPRTRRGPRRRSLLASAAGAALLAGCSSGPGSGSTDGSPAEAARARARAARDSERLAARYDAVIAAHPGLAGRLRPLREEVVRHAQAFGGTPAAGPQASPARVSPSPSPSAAVPGDEKEALAELAAAERALADRRAGALADVPGELARLLASVAAAGAAHVYLLTEGDG